VKTGILRLATIAIAAGVIVAAMSISFAIGRLLSRCLRNRFGWSAWFVAQTRQVLQQVPVLQPISFSAEQRFAGIPFFIEVLRKSAFAAAEVDEVDLLAGFRIHVPVVLHRWISLQ